jgi:hypothetical protein
MEYLCYIKVGKAEIDSLVHTSCGHYTDQFVEEWIAWLVSAIKTLSESL